MKNLLRMHRRLIVIFVLGILVLASVQVVGAGSTSAVYNVRVVEPDYIADHVVISEINITGDPEWVELYNPTGSEVNMSGWYWCYFSSSRNWSEPSKHLPFSEPYTINTKIGSHEFYLMRIDGKDMPEADWNSTYKIGDANTLNNTAGSVGIFPWDPSTKTVEEARNGRIDAVGWGSVDYVNETQSAAVPSSGKSLQRKVNATINESANYGPAWDSDDNSADFFIQDSPNPTNSTTSSANPVPPIPELSTIILFSTGLIVLAGYVLLTKEAVQQSTIGRKRKENISLNPKRSKIFNAKSNCWTASKRRK